MKFCNLPRYYKHGQVIQFADMASFLLNHGTSLPSLLLARAYGDRRALVVNQSLKEVIATFNL